ncbi:hypothetical protein BC939DRAFT_453515, partial [Gamsiella multidivaricata]|uniref:uncharacterized protein n=1 Tax=Gamsiella multidivaricata TaxID=101098 RepID=UPI00221FE05F
MASSPGTNGALTLDQQQQHHGVHPTNNGTSQVARLQQDPDAIVPASDPDDDSTDEDEEYNSYIQEQEQLQFQKHNLGMTRQAQNHYSSEIQEHEEGDDHGEEEYSAYHQYHQQQQQQQQQQPHHHQHQQLQQIQQQYQLQQQQHLHAYKSQAMNIQQLLRQDQTPDQDMSGADSHEEEEYYQQNPQYDPHRQHQMDIDMLHQHDDDDDDFDDDEDGEEDQIDEEMMDEDDEEGSEAMSLTEEDINFDLVYAFHTFVATQEGQASVVRNDSLMLLEDTNVYWWLVRVLKTGVIGYIPAENIETPFERLARLNTYRNVTLSAPSSEWGTFDEHIQPLDPAILQQRAMNRRSVVFTAQNEYLEASETEWTEEEDEEEDWYEDGEEDEEVDDEEEQEGDEELQELEGVD